MAAERASGGLEYVGGSAELVDDARVDDRRSLCAAADFEDPLKERRQLS